MEAARPRFFVTSDETTGCMAQLVDHSDPGFTLRVYTHLMPSSEDRTRRAIDDLFAGGDRPEPA